MVQLVNIKKSQSSDDASEGNLESMNGAWRGEGSKKIQKCSHYVRLFNTFANTQGQKWKIHAI